MMTPVLLIDDDEKLAELLIEYAQGFALDIDAAFNSDSGVAKLQSGDFQAVVLDVMLPDHDGFETCRRIREFSDVPILMLTARGELTDRVVGLELGADDYLAKPFEPRELVARLQSNIKRYQAIRHNSGNTSASTVLEFESLRIDNETMNVSVSGKAVALTTMEYRLLWLLASRPGHAFSRDDILAELKGTENELFSRSVDILVSRLRSKLKPLNPIRTIHGAGYAFVARSFEDHNR